jgi:hypothetical protein
MSFLAGLSICFYAIALAMPVPGLAQSTGEIEDVPDRIVVVGDVHGDYARLREVLELAELIDNRGRWIGGKAHLVQMGDLPDRGDDTLEVIEFLRKLENRARRKGGAVHVLIGNHDAMNVYGDLRYVTDGEYDAFSDRNSKQRLEQLYANEVEWIKENVPEEEWPAFDEAFREKWFSVRPPGFLEHRYSWLPGGEIGDWVLSRPAVLKIGDTLFLHGGLGPKYADWSIEELNTAVHESLKDPDNVGGTILRDEEGPLWYRGLAQAPEAEELPHLEKLLQNFDVERIVLGHTVTAGIIVPRFDGQVILTDVGLSQYYGDYLGCLVIEQGNLVALYRKGRLAIPVGKGDEGLKAYLEQLRDLEGDNPFVEKRLKAIGKEEVIEEAVSEPMEVAD